MKIAILYGTETGNAEMLAEDIMAELEDDHEVTCENLADTDPADLDPAVFHILVCSTYGDGDLPASAQPFADKVTAAKPDFTGLHFAIFGLGDREYLITFAGGSEKLAALMVERGATQVGERLIHDASGPGLAEDLALPWAAEVVAEADGRLGQAA